MENLPFVIIKKRTFAPLSGKRSRLRRNGTKERGTQNLNINKYIN
jgi:hypothetical protein